MIVSHAHRYVFVHVPKTAGTALATVLEAEAADSDWLIGDTPRARSQRRALPQPVRTLGKHARLSEVAPLLAPSQLSRLFVFTLVRNPWDRAVSYYHWLREQNFDHPAVRLAKARSFDEFLAAPQTKIAFAMGSAEQFMRLPDGTMRCDAFVRVEHFTEDIRPFAAHLGWTPQLPTVRVNAAPRSRTWQDFYDARTAQIVAEVCAADIARFAYKFDDTLS